MLSAFRARLRGLHDRVDAAFGAFELSQRNHYISFLHAHARVLHAVEAQLHGDDALPLWRPRTLELDADLAALGAYPRATQPVGMALDTHDMRLGAVYVLEGSRLGGRWLAQRLTPDLPKSYLGLAHPKGSWPAFLEAIERIMEQNPSVLHGMTKGATAVFEAFAAAARAESEILSTYAA